MSDEQGPVRTLIEQVSEIQFSIDRSFRFDRERYERSMSELERLRAEADALDRLHRAAPDLLAACEAAYAGRQDYDVDEMLRAAIAKARGA